MSRIATSRFFDFIDQIKEWQLFVGLFVYAFFIRFPFFFRDYIDRDESTFILMGQSWADGNLPYTELWDLKPPVTFLFFAVIVKIFGKSFLAIRLMGTLLVTIAAFYTFKITKRHSSKSSSIISALLVIVLFSLFGSLQGVMSEHISMAFFIPGLYLFLDNRNRLFTVLAGLLFGLAVMSKLNMGYPLVFLFAFSLWESYRNQNLKMTIARLLVCGSSICFVVFLTFLPYQSTGQPNLWWGSVFKAPLAYAEAQDNSVLKVLPTVLIFGTVLVFLWRSFLKNKPTNTKILLFTGFGVLFSFLQAGKANGHYLIQFYPFLIVLLVCALATFSIFKTKTFLVLTPILILLLPIESYLEYGNIVKNKTEYDTFYNGEGVSVPRYFSENELSTNNILFFEYHIGYWVMGINPPTKAATHPSNLLRDELFPYMANHRTNKFEELKFIFEIKKPEFIVTRKNRRIFYHEKYASNFYAQLELLKNYQVLDTVENAVIHKRLPVQ
ncbi:ArnT family glycosyltransferase [Croceivirga thetidis]|uniref:Glycosyltransferase family 39 protein n=1 Tax=Croceivirga thetidis TaxID=2721623 RepID=A0ABX1GNM6_9FLAO|nr:glycosyltransferase family 39 protein [Croceivirga thetidis]NKI31494.1 glycosyltransferase family 39 protein [Croceivirga thetidis]